MAKTYVTFLVLFLIGFGFEAKAQSISSSVPEQYAGQTQDYQKFLEQLLSKYGSSSNLNVSDIQSLFQDGANFFDPKFAESIVRKQIPAAYDFVFSPQYPGPNETVRLQLKMYGTNLNTSLVEWYVDDKLVTFGLDKRYINLTTGSLGTSQSVRVDVTDASGFLTTANTIVTPSYSDFIWEVQDVTVPPFYKGKALPSYDSVVKVYIDSFVYDRGGNRIPSSLLNYTWTQNGQLGTLNSQSGLGRNYVYTLNDYIRPGQLFDVKAASVDGRYQVGRSGYVQTREPEIVFYQEKPLDGIVYEQALGGRYNPEVGERVALIATPYFFSSKDPSFSDLRFEWSINGEKLDQTSNTLLFNTSRAGTFASIELQTKHSSIPLQRNRADLELLVQ